MLCTRGRSWCWPSWMTDETPNGFDAECSERNDFCCRCSRQLLSPTNLTALTILNTPLREFPVWLSKLPNLQKLAIRGTEIHVIPPGIRHFLALRDFEFVNNDCFSVPDELAELRDLRHLNFGFTQIGTIPDAVLELPRLESLLLTGTNFTAERALHV